MKLGLRNIVNIGELTQQVNTETQHSVRQPLTSKLQKKFTCSKGLPAADRGSKPSQ